MRIIHTAVITTGIIVGTTAGITTAAGIMAIMVVQTMDQAHMARHHKVMDQAHTVSHQLHRKLLQHNNNDLIGRCLLAPLFLSV